MVTLLKIGNDNSINMINDADSNITGGIGSNDNNYFIGIGNGNDDKSTSIKTNLINNIVAMEEKQE